MGNQRVKYFIEGLAEFLFPILWKMLEGGLGLMAQVVNEMPMEIKREDLDNIDRWCKMLSETHDSLKLKAVADIHRRIEAEDRLPYSPYNSDGDWRD